MFLYVFLRAEFKSVARFPLSGQVSETVNFVNALKRDEAGFQYLIKLFPKISYAKIKEGVFVGPDIRKLIDDNNFTKCLSATETAVWKSFKSFVRSFLGKRKSDDCRQIIGDLLRNYRKKGV